MEAGVRLPETLTGFRPFLKSHLRVAFFMSGPARQDMM